MEDELTALIEREYQRRIYGMRCEACHGLGVLFACTGSHDYEIMEPCPVCGGLREINCCDGICEQPEDAASNAADNDDGTAA